MRMFFLSMRRGGDQTMLHQGVGNKIIIFIDRVKRVNNIINNSLKSIQSNVKIHKKQMGSEGLQI